MHSNRISKLFALVGAVLTLAACDELLNRHHHPTMHGRSDAAEPPALQSSR